MAHSLQILLSSEGAMLIPPQTATLYWASLSGCCQPWLCWASHCLDSALISALFLSLRCLSPRYLRSLNFQHKNLISTSPKDRWVVGSAWGVGGTAGRCAEGRGFMALLLEKVVSNSPCMCEHMCMYVHVCVLACVFSCVSGMQACTAIHVHACVCLHVCSHRCVCG